MIGSSAYRIEHEDRDARAEAADERQRQQEAEHRQARNRLDDVGEPDDRRAEPRPPRGEDPDRHAERRSRRAVETPRATRAGRAARRTRRRAIARTAISLTARSPRAPRSPRTAAPAAAGRADRSTARSVARRVERGQHAVGEHADPRRQRERFAHVVGHDHDRLAHLRLDPPELLVHLAAGDRDRARRTARPSAESADRRPARGRRRPADAARRTAGRAARREVGSAEPDQVEQLAHTRADARSSQPSRRGTTAMFSATVMCGKSPTSCST